MSLKLSHLPVFILSSALFSHPALAQDNRSMGHWMNDQMHSMQHYFTDRNGQRIFQDAKGFYKWMGNGKTRYKFYINMDVDVDMDMRMKNWFKHHQKHFAQQRHQNNWQNQQGYRQNRGGNYYPYRQPYTPYQR